MTKSTVSNIGITGVALFVIAAICGAMLIPGYSQVSQFISESYAIDTKYGIYLRMLGYIPSGVLMLLFCFLAELHLPKSKKTSVALKGIGLFYGAGTILTSIFPCDSGCNNEMVDPSVAQLIHSISGLFTYITVPFFIIMLGFAAVKWKNSKNTGKLILFCGFLSFVFAVLFFTQLNSPHGGLIQRLLEGSILLVLLVVAAYLKKSTSF
jgi:Protein of unknown function (DUF998)